MPVTDTSVKQVKHSGKPAGDKHTDSLALYLFVNAAGKYWRMSWRLHGKHRLLALGVYPAVTLTAARRLRDDARCASRAAEDGGPRRPLIYPQDQAALRSSVRFAVAGGLVERDVTAGLRGALSVPKAHIAAITDPAQAGALLSEAMYKLFEDTEDLFSDIARTLLPLGVNKQTFA